MKDYPDTIIYPERFAKSLPAGHDGIFDWAFLKGAFGPVIMPMDFDGVVEKNGNFLLFETKTLDKEVPQGQLITCRALIRTGDWTIFFVWSSDYDDYVELEIWHRNGSRVPREPTDYGTIKARASDWYKWACERKPQCKP